MARSIIKTWELDSLQQIEVDKNRNIYFKDYTGNRRRVFILSYRHFQCLNHTMKHLKYFYMNKHSRIGDRIWLRIHKRRIQIYHSQLSIHFTFHQGSWQRYKRRIHRSIHSFLRHVTPSLHHRQHSPPHSTLYQSRSRNITSTNPQQQVLSGTTPNVSGEDEQHAKYTTLPQRNGTNSRCPFSFIGAVNALRTTEDTASELEEGEVCDVSYDCGQSSDFCSIE